MSPIETKTPADAPKVDRPSWMPLVILGIIIGVLFGIGGASVWWRRHTAAPGKPAPELVKPAAPGR